VASASTVVAAPSSAGALAPLDAGCAAAARMGATPRPGGPENVISKEVANPRPGSAVRPCPAGRRQPAVRLRSCLINIALTTKYELTRGAGQGASPGAVRSLLGAAGRPWIPGRTMRQNVPRGLGIPDAVAGRARFDPPRPPGRRSMGGLEPVMSRRERQKPGRPGWVAGPGPWPVFCPSSGLRGPAERDRTHRSGVPGVVPRRADRTIRPVAPGGRAQTRWRKPSPLDRPAPAVLRGSRPARHRRVARRPSGIAWRWG